MNLRVIQFALFLLLICVPAALAETRISVKNDFTEELNYTTIISPKANAAAP